MDLVGFDVLVIDAVIANVRVRQGDDLLAVAGVGEDFLVTDDGGVENHLSDGRACGSDGIADKDRAVCKRQNGGRESSLKRQKHWVLRLGSGTPQRCAEKSLCWAACSREKDLAGLGRTGLMLESLSL